jgi:hypothetical protein
VTVTYPEAMAMKKIVLAAFIALAGIAALAIPAEARVAVGIGVGGGYYGPAYYGYAPYYAPYYGYPAYYATPPVVYAQPAPTVTYVQPPTYAQPQPTYYNQAPPQGQPQEGAPEQLAPGAPATQTSNTFTDSHGRTCRMFKSTLEDGAPINGSACLQQDGSWKTTE